VRGEDVTWEDEWEGTDPRSVNAIPEVPYREERSVETVSADTAAERQPEPAPPPPRAEPAPAVPTQFELPLEDAVADTASVASPPAAPSEPNPIDARAAVPKAEETMTVLPVLVPSAVSAPPEPALLHMAGASPKSIKTVSQRVTPRIAEGANMPPPLPPLLDIAMPEYTQREQQMLRRLEFPPHPFPEADGRLVAGNHDRFRPALLNMVRGMLDPQVKQEVVADQYNYMGYVAAIYLLAGARDQALFPLLLRVTTDPDLARFHLRHERWLDMPRILATVAPQDLAPIMSLAEWRPLPDASRGLILRTLALLFLWKHTSRECVVHALRQTFEAGIPASDLDLWDVVLDVCWTVHPHEVMGYLRRQMSPAVCRGLRVGRAVVENINMVPMDKVVADARAGAAGPIQGWEDFAKIALEGGSARKGEDAVNEVEPIHATPKTGRNDPCPCGSGRKFKKCCGI